MSLYRGSEWNKWDLHVHTPYTKLNNQYRDDSSDVWEKYCEIIYDSDVKVFGITDYFSVDSYFIMAEKYREKYPESNKVFFPNIEFRLDSKNSSNEHIQIHIIFSNTEQTLRKLNNFLTRLELLSTDNTTLTNKYCVEDDLRGVGYDKAMVQIDNLEKKLRDNFTDNEYLLVGVANGYGSLRPGNNDGRGAEYAKELDKKCQMFFGTSKNTDFYLNKIDGRAQFDLLPKAILSGSDAHSFEDLVNKLGKKFNNTDSEIVWVKADLSFEGLRQVIYEPESRLRLSDNKPQEPLHQLEQVKFSFDADVTWDSEKFCFAGFNDPVIFSPYLTCVIGGRGSGKSTLLNLISEKIGVSENFFSQVDISDLSSHITFTPEIVPDIEFLAQNTIEKFATDSVAFTGAIYKRLDKKSNGQLKLKENGVIENLGIFDEQIRLLKDRLVLSCEISELRNELKVNNNIVKTFTDKIYIDTKKELDEIQKEKSSLERSRLGYKELYEGLKNLKDGKSIIGEPKNNYDKYYNELFEDVTALFEMYDTKDYTGDIELLEALDDEIAKRKEIIEGYLKDKGLSSDNIQDAQYASQNIIRLKDEQKNKLRDLAKIKRKISGFTVDEIDENIRNFEDTINLELEKINAIFKDIAEKNPSEVKLIEVKYELDKNVFEKVFQELENALSIQDKISSFKKTFMEYLAQVSLEDVLSFQKGKDFITSIGTRSTLAYKTLIEIFSDNINFQIYKQLIEKETRNIRDNKVLKVYYDDRPLDNSSFGQKCTAAIVVLLSLGNNPVIIDEPEAHLDSSLIANYLVELIKQQKEQRQIIFATHNANFVLNADTELIIKLENNSGTTNVVNFAIEELAHRDDLLKLEGGKEAFRKRERKYNLFRA